MAWAEIVLLSGGILTVAGAAGFVFKKVLPALRDFSRLMDRFQGVPANTRTGQAAIPSLWETLDHQSHQLAVIKHEVEFNNGSSVKDAVVRNETETARIGQQITDYIEYRRQEGAQ